jgi:hypothetical protein
VSSLFSLKKIVHALFAVGQSPDGGHPFTRTSKYFEEEDELIIEAVVDLMEGNWVKGELFIFFEKNCSCFIRRWSKPRRRPSIYKNE